MTELDLDDYELRSRFIQGMAPLPSLPLADIKPISPSLSSTIGPADAIDYTPKHRPTLSSPMPGLIAAHLETERLAAKGAKLFDADIAQTMSDLDRLNAEKEEALQHEAKAVKARATWDTLSTVAQYIAGASSLVLGYATMGVSQVAGALLMASGGVGLFNRLAHDTPLLDTVVSWMAKSDELQRKITNNIEMGAFYLQMGLGLAGGTWAWKAGAFAAAAGAEAIAEKTSSILGAASGIMMAGSKVGSAVYDKQIGDIHAQMKLTNGQITTRQQTMYQDTSQMSRLVEAAQAETEEIRKAIQALQIQID